MKRFIAALALVGLSGCAATYDLQAEKDAAVQVQAANAYAHEQALQVYTNVATNVGVAVVCADRFSNYDAGDVAQFETQMLLNAAASVSAIGLRSADYTAVYQVKRQAVIDAVRDLPMTTDDCKQYFEHAQQIRGIAV